MDQERKVPKHQPHITRVSDIFVCVLYHVSFVVSPCEGRAILALPSSLVEQFTNTSVDVGAVIYFGSVPFLRDSHDVGRRMSGDVSNKHSFLRSHAIMLGKSLPHIHLLGSSDVLFVAGRLPQTMVNC